MGGFIVGVTRDLSSASEGTFDEILEFNADSLEHVDVAEWTVCIILDFWWLDVIEDALECVDWLLGPGTIWKGGCVDGGMYDLFSTGDLTVDGTLDFKDDSLEYVDVVESIVRAILDCAWNCWIEAGGFLYIWWGGITGGTICMEEGLVFVVVGLIPSSLIDDDWKGGGRAGSDDENKDEIETPVLNGRNGVYLLFRY